MSPPPARWARATSTRAATRRSAPAATSSRRATATRSRGRRTPPAGAPASRRPPRTLRRLAPGVALRQCPHHRGRSRAVLAVRGGQADVVEPREQVAPHTLVRLADPDEPQAPYVGVPFHTTKLCQCAAALSMDPGPKTRRTAPTRWPRMRQPPGPSVEPD